MAAAERPISTDELHAYVDDRLDAVRRREVEQYLDSQPEMARRVAAYRAQRDGLRMVHAAYAAEPIPPRRLRPNTPEWLERIILRLLCKNPAERFPAAAAVATVLSDYCD